MNIDESLARRELGTAASEFSDFGAFGGYRDRTDGQTEGLVPLLSGPLGLLRLQAMAENDETVGSMRWLIETTLMRAQYKHKPQKDGKDAFSDEQAVKWATFADSMLTDMRHSWGGFIQSALSMFWAGFAPCEIVLRQRLLTEGSRHNDAWWGIGALALRDQHSVVEWDTNLHGEVTAMRQSGTFVASTVPGIGHNSGAIPTPTGVIPYWKLLHCRTTQELNRPWGRSLLRPAWRSYWLKQRIQDSEAIGIERDLCGLPTIKVPSEDLALASSIDPNGTPDPKALAARARIDGAIKAVSELRFNRRGGLVLPSDTFLDENDKPSAIPMWDFKIVTTAGQRSIDPRTAIRDYDRAIARVVLMQFLHLGDRSGGSYALSDNQSTMATESLKALADIIVDEYNLKALRLVWQINGFPWEYLPAMESPRISENDLNTLGTFVMRMGQASLMFERRPDVEDQLWTRAGLGGPPPGTPSPAELAEQRALNVGAARQSANVDQPRPSDVAS